MFDFSRRCLGNLESMLDSSLLDEHGPVTESRRPVLGDVCHAKQDQQGLIQAPSNQ